MNNNPADTGKPTQSDSQHEQSVSQNGQIESSQNNTTEIGGPPGLEPTRFGDWEKKGRCIDF